LPGIHPASASCSRPSRRQRAGSRCSSVIRRRIRSPAW
jgi:hypothetical protein